MSWLSMLRKATIALTRDAHLRAHTRDAHFLQAHTCSRTSKLLHHVCRRRLWYHRSDFRNRQQKHHNFCWRVRHNRKWRFRSSAILMGPLWCSVRDVILTSSHLMTSISALSALSNIQPVNNQAHCSLSEPLCYRVLWQKNVTAPGSLRRCITFGDVKCTKVPYHFSQFSLMLVDRQLARPTSNFNGRFV